jgi:glycosyltransferase involved in cell wall biosynthesis
MWNYLEWGGAQIYFLAIMKAAKKDWDIKVVLPRKSGDGFLKFLRENEIEYEFVDTRIDISQAFSVGDKLKRQYHRIASEIKAYRHLLKYDLKNAVLHLETAPWQSWILIFALARRGNVFVTMHNALPVNSEWKKILWSKRLNFILGLKNFHLFTANQNAKDSLKNLVTAENWEKITLTRAGINPSEIESVLENDFDRRGLLQKHKIPEDKFLILCVGQFIDRKGRWIFLEAAEKIVEKDDSFHFLWLTPVAPDCEDREKIEKYELKDSFQIILSEDAGKNRFDILSFFRLADIFVLPSFFEGLPIAVLEAMALGIPTISTNITAVPEAVKSFETGILVEKGDSSALASAILDLRKNSGLRDKLSAAGRKFVLENFDERKTARIAVEHYERALKDLTEISK